MLGGQARLTRVPCLVRLAIRGVAILLRGKYPLVVHGNGVKIGIAQVALWKKAAQSSIRRMIRRGEYVPVDRSGECPEEGDHLWCEDSAVAE